MAIERTLVPDAPVTVSCVDGALKSLNMSTVLSEAHIYYESRPAGMPGTVQFKKKSKDGFKKVIHANLSGGDCFEDIDAVAAVMEKTEAHILQHCGLTLKKPVTQKITGPDKSCR